MVSGRSTHAIIGSRHTGALVVTKSSHALWAPGEFSGQSRIRPANAARAFRPWAWAAFSRSSARGEKSSGSSRMEPMIRSLSTMLAVGLTGGIGSGKSTVAGLLANRGAVVIDADLLAREAVEPGSPGYDAVVDRFGPAVVEAGGGLDRQALADVVFADPAARADLNGVVHPR